MHSFLSIISALGYWAAVLSMVLWVFIWPVLVSADAQQPQLWPALMGTLVIYLLTLFTRLYLRARMHTHQAS